MGTVQLQHPDGKKAISMDSEKYEILRAALLDILKQQRSLDFASILVLVEKDIKNKKLTVRGKLEWNLFWVTLDQIAKNKITRDKMFSPVRYSFVG